MKVKVPEGAPKGRYILETRFFGSDVPFTDTAEFYVTGARR
ncbi:MAG: hypothetical protein P4L83_07805 [Nevskia sp.]|nr:hypothetical protein [Nevskia sp.]